jgi:selenocysteine lyase/cysteine desulfurase
LDIHKVRKDTRGCHDKLFFDSAGASLSPSVVTDAVAAYLKEEELIGGYRLAELQQDAINGFYSATAQMLGCREDNIALSYNATDAFAKALSSVPLKEGDVIVTTDGDYISNFVAFISLKKKLGIHIIRMNNREDGSIDIKYLDKLLSIQNVALVSVSHVPTSSGVIQDVEGIGKICRRHQVWYMVDACQSVGQMPVDVHKIGCDFLSATGRKFLRGPRGTGFLYVSDRVLESNLSPLFPDMRGALWTGVESYKLVEGARRYELWEYNYANVLGLKEAINYGNKLGWDNIYNYNQSLSAAFRQKLEAIEGVSLYDNGPQLSNIITVRKEGIELDRMKKHLTDHNIYFSVASATNAIIDMPEKGIDWAIRLSPHYFNTAEECEQVCTVLEKL